MHKDLSQAGRNMIEDAIRKLVDELALHGDSLGIGRGAMLNAFDAAAEELTEA